MKTLSLRQSISWLLFVFLTAILCFERYWVSSNIGFYTFIGLLGAVIIITCIVRGRLIKCLDVQLILLLFFYIYVSITVSYGFSSSPRILRFYGLWTGIFALYFLMRISADRKRLLSAFSAVSVLSLSFMCISGILNASHAICKEVPPHDIFRGSFEMGRLCGFNNANFIGLAGAALLFISVFGLLRSRRWFRMYYIFGILIGWFTLGLTNSRTCMIGFSVSASLLFVFILHKKYLTGHPVIKWVLTAVIFLAGTVLIVSSFYLPMRIYRLGAGLYGRWRNNAYLLNNIGLLSERWLIDDDGTFADRINIWIHSLKAIFSSPRRLLFGVSPIRTVYIGGVYEGRHDITTPHAHNIFIEILRLYGVIGLTIWLAMIVRWVTSWVKTLSASASELSEYYSAAACFGMLLMGSAEPLPLLTLYPVMAAVPFVVMSASMINKQEICK